MTKQLQVIPAILLACIALSCAPKQYAVTERLYRDKAKGIAKQLRVVPPTGQWLGEAEAPGDGWIASPNFGTRKPNYVIIHHTAQISVAQTVQTFHNQQVGVSAHYLIGRDGTVIQSVNELFRAHHAGVSKWGNDTDLNSSSIGIELDNNGTTDLWPEAQVSALLTLLSQLKERYKIPQANFLGHMDVSPTRKIDPARFPWKTLAEHGFGYWYDGVIPPAPAEFDPLLALRVIGYDITAPEAAIRAFKRHYVQHDDGPELNDTDSDIIYAIFLKYR